MQGSPGALLKKNPIEYIQQSALYCPNTLFFYFNYYIIESFFLTWKPQANRWFELL